MTGIIVFTILSILLVCGKIVRVKVPLIQKLYLPSSVVGGLLGLILISCLREYIPADIISMMQSLPGFLINIIFATLFLGGGIPRIRNLTSFVGPQLAVAQIVSWGQYVVGIGLCALVLVPIFGVSPAFGNLLEMGFEGGHGTIGGMSNTFTAYGWSDGIALGYTVATAGMVTGMVIGMLLVNWAYARGFIKTVRPFHARLPHEKCGIYQRDDRPPAGLQTVLPDSVDSLAWHIAIVGLAVLAGFCILHGFKLAEVSLFPAAKTRIFTGFPMFPLCMIGGLLLEIAAKVFHIKLLIDKDQMTRISGASLDYLAVSAIATIQLSVVAANWIPLSIMIVSGVVWTIASILFFARKLFKEAWFERGIAEFGQATGVTATGLLLLRTVDPDNKTIAAAAFAGKQLLHEPIMNLWVALGFALIFTVGWLPVFIVSAVMLTFWMSVAFVIMWRTRRKA